MTLTEIEFRTLGMLRKHGRAVEKLPDEQYNAIIELCSAKMARMVHGSACITPRGRKAHNDEMLKRTKNMGKPLFEVLR